jgi:hypothetical protein
MGPLLFLIYINGLTNSVVNSNLNDNPKTIPFADDTVVKLNNLNFADFEKC